MEIERKFLVKTLPPLKGIPSKKLFQAYISVMPVIRIRKAQDTFLLTIKSQGNIAREEHEISINASEFQSLLNKIEGHPIEKTRYYIPLENGLTAELDIFSNHLSPLTTVEVEFPSLDAANAFIPPIWFGEDISLDHRYKNNNLAIHGLPEKTSCKR